MDDDDDEDDAGGGGRIGIVVTKIKEKKRSIKFSIDKQKIVRHVPKVRKRNQHAVSTS